MRRAAAAIFVFLWLIPAAAGAKSGVAVTISAAPTVVDTGQAVRVKMRVFDVRGGVRTLSDAHHFRLVATSTAGRTLPVPLRRISRGTLVAKIRFDTISRWRLSIVNWPGTGTGPVVDVSVRRAGPTPPPPGFASLGRPNCKPESPRNMSGEGLASREVFGTTIHGRFWALVGPASWGSASRAVLQGVVGKVSKIVFKLDAFPKVFFAVAPDGTPRRPTSGPTKHVRSTWTRAGIEWGAEFVFDKPGCWKIHAAVGAIAGDIWLQVES
jgi:hypothetical protein